MKIKDGSEKIVSEEEVQKMIKDPEVEKNIIEIAMLELDEEYELVISEEAVTIPVKIQKDTKKSKGGIDKIFHLLWLDGFEEYIVGVDIHDVISRSSHQLIDENNKVLLDEWEIINPNHKKENGVSPAIEKLLKGNEQFDKIMELNAMSSLDPQDNQILNWNLENFNSQLKNYKAGIHTNMTEVEELIFKNASKVDSFISEKAKNPIIGGIFSGLRKIYKGSKILSWILSA
jgi:hypothetical protein